MLLIYCIKISVYLKGIRIYSQTFKVANTPLKDQQLIKY